MSPLLIFRYVLTALFFVGTPLLAEEESLVNAMADHLQCYPMELVSLEKQQPTIMREEVCLASIYHEMGFAPLWVTEEGPTLKAKAILSCLERSDSEGLDPSDYQVDAIAGMWHDRNFSSLAVLDTMLTYSVVKYVHDISYGQIKPYMADPKLFAEAGNSGFDPLATIEQLVQTQSIENYLSQLSPDHFQYRGLRDGLSFYRTLVGEKEWDPIDFHENISPGDRDERVILIRQRVATLLDRVIVSSADEMLYDDGLKEEILLFQNRHGLKEDGIIGRNTLRELNVTPGQRMDQIRINMARWRWQDHNLGDDYVLVNIANFHLYAYREGVLQLSLPVIVGKRQHQTPVFSDSIKYVEFNPFWNVPPSIAVKEDLPKLRLNPNHLAEKNIRLFSNWQEDGVELNSTTMDWTLISRSQMARYKLRQDPGPNNSLGRIKFVFPNHYSVYMHDTPAKNLFAEHDRFFSHGCIRVSSPERLALFVLAYADGDWGAGSIEKAMENGKRRVVRLSPPLPIHITYQTAWLDKKDRIHFNRDIYRRDEKLFKALFTQ